MYVHKRMHINLYALCVTVLHLNPFVGLLAHESTAKEGTGVFSWPVDHP